jgi:DNA-binding MarR family transcriptional regulator
MVQDQTDAIVAAALGISRTLRKQMHCKPTEGEGNMLQVHALMHIREHEGMTMKEVAEHLQITSPSATSFVNRLVKLGWVQRVTDSENRKLVRIKVSEKGDTMLQATMKQRKEHLRGILSLLPTKDQQDLARILTSLAHSLSHSS